MNKNLTEELKTYFHKIYMDSLTPDREVPEVEELYKEIEKLGLGFNEFGVLESRIMNAINARELQGFLQGYKHCLTMMDLSNGTTA